MGVYNISDGLLYPKHLTERNRRKIYGGELGLP